MVSQDVGAEEVSLKQAQDEDFELKSRLSRTNADAT